MQMKNWSHNCSYHN
uniref:Uncharacterized protein n=1 Tax=Arundo donax TaxID=35708 RepID=A0A0A9FD45_ARUDO